MTTTASGTYLHVVYAGRGDCFLVEYQDSTGAQVSIVDGGPTNYSSAQPPIKLNPGNKRTICVASNYVYFLSCIKNLWTNQLGKTTKFAPQVIWISHAHQDHYAGIVHLLVASAHQDVAHQDMAFTAPVYVPGYWVKRVDVANGEIEERLTQSPLNYGVSYGAPKTNAGFTIDYPAESNVATYAAEKAGAGPPLGSDFTVDTSKFNVESALLRHEVKGGTGGTTVLSRIYFTGDSVGWNVSASMPRPLQPIAIYKIQHHGSMRNTMSSQANATISSKVICEFRLGAILDFMESPPSVATIPVTIPCPFNGLQQLGNALYAVWNTLFTNGETKQAVLAELRSRRQQVFQQAADPKTTAIRARDETYSAVWTKFRNKMTEHYSALGLVYIPDFFGALQLLRHPEWYNRFNDDNIWKEPLLLILTTNKIRAFFASFVAYSYVISADGEYGHASPATLVGLAWAMKNNGRTTPTPLYLTAGSSVDSDGIQQVCDALNLSRNTLFDPQNIEIMCMRANTVMKLDASLDATIRRHDPNQVQVVDPATFVDFGTLRADYGASRVLLPTRSLGVDYYTITAQLPDSTEVALSIGATGPVLVPGTSTPRLQVYEGWMDDVRNLTTFQVRDVVTGNSFVLDYEVLSRTDGRILQGFMWTDASTKVRTFFAANGTATAASSQDPPLAFVVTPATSSLTAVHKSLVTTAPTTTRSLQQYCTDAGLAFPASPTGKDALVAVVGADNAAQLGFASFAASALASLASDLTSSTVTYDSSTDPAQIVVTAANIVLQPNQGFVLNINGNSVADASIALSIDWPLSSTATATTPTTGTAASALAAALSFSEPSSGLALTVTRGVAKAPRVGSLAHFLAGAGFAASSLSTLTVASIMSFLEDSDNKMLSMMARVPSVLLTSNTSTSSSNNIMQWTVDMTASNVVAETTPFGSVVVREAKIVAVTGSTGLSGLSMAGLTFSISQLAFVLRDPMLKTESISMIGSASLTSTSSGSSGSSSGSGGSTILASLDLEVQLEETGTSRLVCSLNASITTLSGLLALLPTGANDLGSAVVPWIGSDLASLTTFGLGFVVSQPTALANDYDLESVFMSTSFTDWQHYLPTSFALPASTKFSVDLQVLNPLVASSRRVRAAVDFQMAVPSAGVPSTTPPTTPPTTVPATKTLQFGFAAEPLVGPGDYEFRLYMGAADGSDAVTLTDVLTTVGLGSSLSTTIDGALPLVGSILNAVSVNQISGSVVATSSSSSGGTNPPTQTWNFTDWSLDLAVSNWVLVPNLLTIVDAHVLCESQAGLWTCRAEAYLSLDAADGDGAVLVVSFLVPRPDLPGFISIDNPMGLTASQFMTSFQLPDLSGLPVIGTLLDTAILNASLTLGYDTSSSGGGGGSSSSSGGSGTPGATSSVDVLGASITLGWDSLQIGFISLDSVELSLMYEKPSVLPSNPSGGGSSSDTGPPAANIRFSVQSLLADNTMEVDLVYDSVAQTIAGTMRPLQTSGGVTVSQMLGKLVGGVDIPNNLLPLIGALNIDLVAITLSSADFSVKTFTISLVADASVEMNNAVRLSSLSLRYAAAVPAQAEKPAVPTLYVLRAQTMGTNAQADIEISCIQEETLALAPSAKSAKLTGETGKETPSLGSHLISRVTAKPTGVVVVGDNPTPPPPPPPAVTTVFKASLKETPGGTCTLTGLMALFGILPPTYPSPQGLTTNFFDLEIVSASAEVSLSSNNSSGGSTSSSSSFQLESLQVAVQTTGTLTILTAPNITITRIQFELDYQRTGTTTGFVSGGVRIDLSSSSGGSGNDNNDNSLFIWAKYDGTSYRGTATLAAGQQVDFQTMASQWVSSPSYYRMPTDPVPPASIPCTAFEAVLVPGTSFELWAHAQTSWSFNAAGVDLTLNNLGGWLKISQGTLPADDVYEAYLYGDLSFVGFDSTAAVNVGLRLGTGNPTILTAVLTPSPTSDPNQQMGNLTSKLDDSSSAGSGSGSGSGSTSTSAWSSLLPVRTSTVAFAGASSAFLYVDFAAQKFAVFGQIQGMGSGMLLGRPRYSGTGRSYLFSLVLTDLTTLLPDLVTPLAPFNFVEVGVDVMAMDGTMAKLKTDLGAIAAVAGQEGVNITSAVPTLAGFDGDQTLDTGVSVYAIVDLAGSSTLSNVLGLAANNRQASSITLSAFLRQSNPVASIFTLSVDHFSMLGGAVVIVTGQGIYAPNPQTLTVTGNVAITLDASATALDLQIALEADQTTLSFYSTTTGTIATPFGGMLGITLTQASFSGRVTSTAVTYTLQGDVQLGPLALHGSILFSDHVPTVASVSITQSISVTSLLNAIIPALVWPAGFDPITFNVPSSLYYARADATVDGIVYSQGYNLSSSVSFFGLDFLVTANFTTQGVLVDAAYAHAIDLGFLKLIGYTDATQSPPVTNAGPSVQINTRDPNNTIYKAQAGVVFFGLDSYVVDADVAYQSGQEKWVASLTLAQGFFGIPTGSSEALTARISYQNGHWQIDRMPFFADLENALDLAKTIMDATSDEQACGKLVGLVFTEVITTKWNLSLGNASADIDASGNLLLRAEVSGTYDINVVGTTIRGVAMPVLPIVVAGAPFTSDRLGTVVAQTLIQSTASIGVALLQQPQAVIAILGAVAVSHFSRDVITNLLCRDFDAPDLVEAGVENMNTSVEEFNGNGGEAAQAGSAGASVTSSTSLAEAVTALGTAVSLLATAAAVFASIASLIDKLLKFLFGSAADDARAKKQAAQDKMNSAQQAVDSGNNFIATALNLSGLPTATFAPDKPDTVVVSWDKVLPNQSGMNYAGYADFTWRVTYGLINNMNAPGTIRMTPIPAQTVTITNPLFITNPTVYVWVEACYRNKYFSKTPAAAQNPANHVPLLPPVPPFHIAMDSSTPMTTLTVALPSNPAGSNSWYQVNVVDASNSATVLLGGSKRVLDLVGAAMTVTFPVLDLRTPPAPLSSSVMVQATNVSTEPTHQNSQPTSSVETIPVVNAPGGLAASVSVDGNSLIISWLQTSSSTTGGPVTEQDFQLFIRDSGSTATWQAPSTMSLVPNPPPGTVVVALSGSEIVDGKQIDIAVRAKPSPAAMGSLCLFAELLAYTVYLVPTPSISTTDSWVDLHSQGVVVVFNLNGKALPTGAQCRALLSRVSGGAPKTVSPAASATPFYQDATTGTANVPTYSLYFAPGTAQLSSLPMNIQIRLVTSTNEQGPLSASWLIPAQPVPPLALANCNATFIRPPAGPALAASWNTTDSRGTTISVMVTNAATAQVLATKSVPLSSGSVQFKSTEIVLFPEMEFRICFTPETAPFHGEQVWASVTSDSGLALAISLLDSQNASVSTAWALIARYEGTLMGPLELFATLVAARKFPVEFIVDVARQNVPTIPGTSTPIDWASIGAQLRAIATAFVPLVSNPPSGLTALTPRNAIRLVGNAFPSVPSPSSSLTTSALLIVVAGKQAGLPSSAFIQYGSMIPGVADTEIAAIVTAVYTSIWTLGVQIEQAALPVADAVSVVANAWPNIAAETAVAVLKSAGLIPTLAQLQASYPDATQAQLDAVSAALSDTAATPVPGHALARLLAGDTSLTTASIAGLLLSVYSFLTPAQVTAAMGPDPDLRPWSLGYNGTTTFAKPLNDLSANVRADLFGQGFTVEASVFFPSPAQLSGYNPIFTLVYTMPIQATATMTFQRGTPFFELGLQDGKPVVRLLLPKALDGMGYPIAPIAQVPFSVTDTSPAAIVPPRIWSNVSATWTHVPAPAGSSGAGLNVTSGLLSVSLDGVALSLVAPGNPTPNGSGPGTTLPTTMLVTQIIGGGAPYSAAMGIGYTSPDASVVGAVHHTAAAVTTTDNAITGGTSVTASGPPAVPITARAYCRGQVSNIRFWSPARTSAAVAADAKLGPFPPVDVRAAAATEGLVNYWGCGEGNGQTLHDEVGGFDAFITDPVWVAGQRVPVPVTATAGVEKNVAKK